MSGVHSQSGAAQVGHSLQSEKYAKLSEDDRILLEDIYRTGKRYGWDDETALRAAEIAVESANSDCLEESD